MRLEKIKLAGFKSFVDPTTVPFPSNLAGVVGPNGCGKSNVIDAVRWVMGESSAKMLRGESMADVIFNGSTSRKPVGTAGVELLFDNGDGSAGGEYAKYAQISVKRQVSRDGQSSYFLNGSRCRRRDIQDLFLGTGLGPRSYAIIEQGMISRLIEARPEDLRLFLEEAAGISKYKERRRETEGRIRQTRDNLDRLTDLREELAKQLLHLERQAAAAEKYRRLREDERRLAAELKALRWRTLDEEVAASDRQITGLEIELEAVVARRRRIEAEGEEAHQGFVGASDAFNEVQGRYYAVGAEIARIEQAIQFARETRAKSEAELARLARELEEAEAHVTRDQATLAEIDALLALEEPEAGDLGAAAELAHQRVAAAESALAAGETQWEELARQAARPGELAQVERARINALETRMGQDQARRKRLEDDLARLAGDGLTGEIAALGERERATQAELDRLAEEQSRTASTLAERIAALRAVGGQLDAVRTELQSARGRQASLIALQEAALGGQDDALVNWLQRQGLGDAARLADHLEVESGWEAAVEAVLAAQLRAVCAEDLGRLGDGLAGGEVAALALFDTGAPVAATAPAGTLAEQVRCPWSLTGLLGAVRTADSLAEALGRRSVLGLGEALVTRDGVLVGPNWLSTPDSGSALRGVLQRGEALKALDREVAALAERVAVLAGEQERLREERRALEAGRDALAADAARLQQSLSGVRADLSGRRARLEHQNERRAALVAEREELSERLAEALDETGEARERLHAALAEIDALAERRETLATEREAYRAGLTEARQEERGRREQLHRLQVSIGARRAARAATEVSLVRTRERCALLSARREELRLELKEAVEPLAEQEDGLAARLALRLGVEGELAAARQRLESLDAQVRGLEQERQRVEREVAERQRALDARRLVRQELLVRRRTLEEQLGEDGLSPAEALAALPAEASEAGWQAELERVVGRIERLGNINLAAIDEFDEQSQRKQYLDAQHADIARSLETLEQAIRRIDRETRGRFKDTYDRVNQGLQQLFPRLFGGGHAYLELTGEDLLETGVAVMARPPGKRNSSIHLLSGGEKALTAVALVFAIFQLNPAPFCMLDEVDAPLDDANVGRFCELVRSMSDQVQFIFITHNKVTMEIADHLLGVTMHEPGVSRLVAVDVDEAARLAAVS